ncbi:Putative rRNA biogenesis protein Rrp5 [Septoria linicola]|uniref:rRNA biogenesis protein RRP5 n=1 Tax=Septoria linicola TaxID=215465 RepID=A0A9Q9EHL2_9PEZI|nr:Putative rRNA biogenesis protein Rrp5 [Septoria linicola]
MAPVKRKAVTDERPSKKAKPAAEKEEVKPDRTEARKEEKRNAKEKKERLARGGAEPGEKKAPLKSILQQEEKAFPRGGGSVLTPIERKQIEAQAERDVLYEQETGQKADAKDDDGALFDERESAPAKKKRKTGRKSDGLPQVEGSSVKIAGLSYKTLVVGSVVLGRVTAITGRDIALALPNNLTGYVPITAVSERLTARIERLLDDAKPGADESEDDEDIDLKQLFHIGQWLRATVTSTGTDPAEGKSKKHIELSLDPTAVNGGLPEDNVVVNSTVQATVRSVEDHGLIMDLGLSDESVNGFVSKKELGSAYKLDKVQEGQVMLCLVTGKGSNGKVLKISPDPSRMSLALGDKKLPTVSDAPSVDAFLPGTAVDILITESGLQGVVGKIMGMLDVTADAIHAQAIGLEDKDVSKKYKVGSKTQARIIFTIPGDDGARRVGVSFLAHTLALVPAPDRLPDISTKSLKTQAAELDQLLAMSSVVEAAKITQVSPNKGLYLKFPIKHGRDERTATAFAHISQISDKRIDSLSSTSGSYTVDSEHKVRIIGYSPIDNVYYVSLKQSVLDQAFLRLEDLSVGAVVDGTVDKIILGGTTGVTGILVKLSDNITGLVPEQHISDAQLKNPERKYREGFPVKARILSVDMEKRHVRLTLKKQLVDDASEDVWSSYRNLKPGMESKGTIIKLHPNGAVVQFYGQVRAWLPVAEMSETFIEKPEQHFRSGQTVNVKIVSVTPESQEMKVTCKDSVTLDEGQEQTWNNLSGGQLVSGVVTQNLAESITIDLESGLKGQLRLTHLVDGSLAKAEKEAKRIRVGQKLKNLLVLDKQDRSQTVLLSNKPSLVDDAKADKLISTFSDVHQGAKVHGFVRNTTSDAIYVEFTNGIVGLLPKSQIQEESLDKPDFGVRKDQTLSLWILDTDDMGKRFRLTMREQAASASKTSSTQVATDGTLSKPVDSSLKSMSDLEPGKITKARVVSIRATQINVRLADNVQGRVDVSEVFDTWEEITNKASPLQSFKQNDLIDVKILGIHDARNHRFLPFSHRQGKVPVFELSAKKSRVQKGDGSLLELESVKAGSSYLAFVNNHADNCVWVNLSPNVRGRVALMDLSDDVGQLQNVENRFRVGCALRVKVKSADVSAGRLDLTAKQDDASTALALKDLSPGMVLPARVIKSTERAVSVELAKNLVCHVPLVELTDDYDQINLAQYSKNDIVRACVVNVDAPNKRAFVSLRPSKVLSSSLPVKDAQISSAAQVKAGDLVRGFVKKVADKGVFISLGADVDALVRIADLSDQFVKEWRGIYEVDQLVKGRVLSVDADSKQIQLSLKPSHVGGHYEPPLSIGDLEAGMTVTGKVRKVEDFGAFIDIDNTQPRLSGLCHRSEVAARRIEDVRKLYSAGDVVKAKVLSVDAENRKISLGLKASYFANEAEESEEEDDQDSEDEDVDMDGGVELEDDSEGGIDLEDVQAADSEDEAADDAMDVDEDEPTKVIGGLKTSGFDWAGNGLDADTNGAAYESEPETVSTKKKKRKSEIKEDLTGDLDKNGPQSNSDFERQLLGQPNNSGLWIQYMAFQLRLSEIQQARNIAERALRTINIRESDEKMNIWIAWMNLEVEYGDDDSVEEVFKNATQVQDPLEVHEKLASIYIDSGKHDKADGIFERIVGNKNFRASPDVWLNYATFLFDSLRKPERARALLTKALQSVPTNEHRLLTAKFAALEFRSASGDAERGRTIFEGLLAEWPKWSSGWDMWVDIERSRISSQEDGDAKVEALEKTRALFERLAQQPMKKRRAKFVFKKWLEFENKEGKENVTSKKGKKGTSGCQAERVTVLARDYVQKLEEKKAAGGAEDDEE